MKRRIEIIFENLASLTITTERIREFNNRLEIFDIEEHKMIFVNIEEIMFYTIKPLDYKEETNGQNKRI